MNNSNDTFELTVEGDTGAYQARLHGQKLADSGDVQVFLGVDEFVHVYDGRKGRLHQDVQLADLRDWLTDDEDYVEVMHALGEQAVVDIGLPE